MAELKRCMWCERMNYSVEVCIKIAEATEIIGYPPTEQELRYIINNADNKTT